MSSKFSMILVLLFMFSVTAVYAQSPASISVHKQVKPVFKGEVHNPVLKFEVMTSQNDVEAGQFDLQIGESTARLIDAIEIYYTGSEQSFSAQQLAGRAGNISAETSVQVNQPLEQGRNYFWVSVRLNDSASLTDLLEINSKSVQLNGTGYHAESDRPHVALRPAVKVRSGGQDNVHTYRIPGMATSNGGTLLDVYDIRRDNSGDLQGDIDVGLSRSTDGGETWEPMQVIMDMVNSR